jgi:hypothetical protein
MPDAIHPWDLVSEDLKNWLETEPQYYIDQLKGGFRSPFSADVSEQEKLDYYRRQVFMQHPDGTPDYSKPNQAGRDMLMKRVGIDGYTQIIGAVMPVRSGLRAAQAATTPDDPEHYDQETMRQDQEREAGLG